MKLGFVIPVPEKGDSLHEFYQKLKLLKDLGYDGVELAVRNPKEIDEKKIIILIKGLKLEVPAIATGKAFTQDKLSLTSKNESIQLEAVLRLKDQILLASQFGAKVIIGLIRGRLQENSNPQKAKESFCQTLNAYGGFARDKGVQLVLEPLNRYETDFIHTLEEAKEVIREIDCDNVYILADTFHMNIEEKSIYESLKEFGDLITHIHVADSNRLAPGQGHLGFPSILKILKEIGYQGFLTTELVPVRPDFETAAKQSIEYLRNIIKRI